MRSSDPPPARRFAVPLLVVGVLALVAGIWYAESRDVFRDREAEGRAEDMLTRPLRLEAPSARLVSEFLEGLRTFHYRAPELGTARYRDRFYDTPGGDLLAAGISYRLRESVGDDARWSLRFERRSGPGANWSIDIRSKLPDEIGEAIAAGDWGRAVTGTEGYAAPDRLRARLEELSIDPADVAPRLDAELERTRHELTDKGRSWFELDVERWTFRRSDGERELSITDVVIDTNLGRDDPEIRRRVDTMDMLVRTMFAFEETDRIPVERARDRLR